MSKMKDSGFEWIGEIPEGWNIERLAWHLEEIKENNKPEKSRNILSLTNKLGVVPYEEKGNQGNVSKEDYTQYKLAYPGTIVANSMNILIGSVGKCDYFGCVSPVYYVFKPRKGENLEFFNYLFQLKEFQKELRKYANGILEIRLRVSSSNILNRFVAIPCKEYQQKIVHFLDKKCFQIDRLISNQEKQIDNLKAYKQSLIDKFVIQGLNTSIKKIDSNIDGVDKIPYNWKIVKTGRIFKENNRPKKENDIPLSLSQVDGLIETENMQENSLKSASYSNWKHVILDDLVLNRFKAHLGVLFASNIEGMVSFHYGVYEAKEKLCPKYYEYLYHSTPYKGILGNMSNGMVQGLQNLSNQNFYSVWSLFPPFEEQNEIVELLDAKCTQVERLVVIKQSKIRMLNEYKKSLIYEYVTGKKKIK